MKNNPRKMNHLHLKILVKEAFKNAKIREYGPSIYVIH